MMGCIAVLRRNSFCRAVLWFSGEALWPTACRLAHAVAPAASASWSLPTGADAPALARRLLRVAQLQMTGLALIVAVRGVRTAAEELTPSLRPKLRGALAIGRDSRV